MTSPPTIPPGNGGGTRPDERDLTGRTLTNFLWMFAGGGTASALKIGVLLILARVLSPTEFGIVSAALTVVALAEITGQIGIAPSIVQVKDLTHAHMATGFVATVLMGFLLALAFYSLSAPIALLYQMPEVAPLIEVFALLFAIKGIGMVSEALMQREMRFRTIAILQLVSYLVGYASVAVTLALLGFGVWALVWGQLGQALLLTVGYVLLAHDGLGLGFKWSTFKSMLRFGFGVSLTQIGNYISQNADYFIVGRFLGPEALGFYSRAYLLLKQFSQIIGRMGDQVLFPTLSSIQDDRQRLQRALNRTLSLVAMLQVPLTALLVITAPEIILVLMGPQWEPAILPFQILVGVLFFRTAYKFVGSILRASGKVYVAALWQWGHAAAVCVGAYFGKAYDVWGVSLGVSAAVIFCHLFGLALVHRCVGVDSSQSLRRLVIYAMLGAVMAAILVVMRATLLPVLGSLLTLLALITFIGLFYLALLASKPSFFGGEGEVLRERLAKLVKRRSNGTA